MSGITLEQAQARLDDWLAADARVATGQAYEIGERKLTRADAAEIRRNIDYWQGWVSRLSPATSPRIGLAVPR